MEGLIAHDDNFPLAIALKVQQLTENLEKANQKIADLERRIQHSTASTSAIMIDNSSSDNANREQKHANGQPPRHTGKHKANGELESFPAEEKDEMDEDEGDNAISKGNANKRQKTDQPKQQAPAHTAAAVQYPGMPSLPSPALPFSNNRPILAAAAASIQSMQLSPQPVLQQQQQHLSAFASAASSSSSAPAGSDAAASASSSSSFLPRLGSS